jgi:hypothetical protein
VRKLEEVEKVDWWLKVEAKATETDRKQQLTQTTLEMQTRLGQLVRSLEY